MNTKKKKKSVKQTKTKTIEGYNGFSDYHREC